MYTGIDTMTASPEVRQLAEKLQAQGIVATMAGAIGMAQSMLETSNKVMKDFNPKYGEDDEPFTNPHKGDGDEDKDEDEGHQEEEKAAVQIIKKPELTLHELMGREESHELKFLGDKVHITQVKEELLPIETPKIEPHQPMSPLPSTPFSEPTAEKHQSQLTLPAAPEAEVKPMELPPAPKAAPKNDGLYQKVDLTAVFGKH